jgi:hypothetical protein
MHETDFEEAYNMGRYEVDIAGDDNWFLYQDNGAEILAVAHLDTVMAHSRRTANFAETAAGPVIFSGALDDRLGAYTILELLPAMGIKYDLLLTVGEESGQSTAQFFAAEKEYNWMIEFDRGGTDVVMYQYDNAHVRELVSKSGARPANGIFSDISYMEHLGIKGFNWGVGYRDYHGPRSHAFLEDYWTMIGHYLKFHDANAETSLPHTKMQRTYYGYGGGYSSSYSSSSLWGGSDDADYKSLRGEKWWDEPASNVTDESDNWTEEQWDAFIDDGIEAARALAPGYEDKEQDEVIISLENDDLVSDDFSDVNKALTSTGDVPNE